MRVKNICGCLSLKQGALIGIVVDVVKVLITLCLLIFYLYTKDDKTLQGTTALTTSIPTLKSLDFTAERAKSISTVVVIFICDIVKHFIVSFMGIIVVYQKFKLFVLGTYFWVKFIQSFFNVFSSFLYLSLT